MSQYMTKPVRVEAVRFTKECGDSYVLYRTPLPDGVRCDRSAHNKNDGVIRYASFSLQARDGRYAVSPGDWIVTYSDTHREVMVNDDFERKFVPVSG